MMRYETFLQQPSVQLSEVIKRDHKATEKCHIYFKEFNDSENR